MILAALAAALLSGCIATDGDSIRCGRTRLRLAAIDAPEMGRCRPKGRRCVRGDPIASRDNLARLIAGRRLRVEPLSIDLYSRTVAIVRAGDIDLSCAQLRAHVAVYKRRWDQDRRIGRSCHR